MSEVNTNQDTQQQPTTPTPEASGGQGGERTFTQSELDRIVQDRLARDRASREQELTQREQALADREKDFEARQFNTILDQALAAAGAKNLRAVTALLDMSKVSLVDGKLVGLDEQLEALKTAPDSHFLFVAEQPRRTGMSHNSSSWRGTEGGSYDEIAEAFKPKGSY